MGLLFNDPKETLFHYILTLLDKIKLQKIVLVAGLIGAKYIISPNYLQKMGNKCMNIFNNMVVKILPFLVCVLLILGFVIEGAASTRIIRASLPRKIHPSHYRIILLRKRHHNLLLHFRM